MRLQGLFPYGTATYDRLAFQKQLDEIAADVSAGHEFSRGSDGKVRSGLALLADNMLHPAMPPAAFDIVRRRRRKSSKARSKPGLSRRPRDGQGTVPKEDPALRRRRPTRLLP